MLAIPNIPASLSRAIYADLCGSLPPPAENTPEAHALRDERAMTAVAHLLPGNAAEADVAVQIVAAQFHARDALRSAAVHASVDPMEVRRCRAQAASMMGHADRGLRTLMRLQAERQKAEAAMHPAAMERAGYWFKPVSEPEPPPDPAMDAATEPAEPPRKEFGAMTPAEQYAALYPDRAKRILAERGLPAHLTFPPPEPGLVTELLASTSPIVRALDQSAYAAASA
jgi:hypothetical protein